MQESQSKCPRTRHAETGAETCAEAGTVTELRSKFNLGRNGNARYDSRCIFRGGKEVEIVHDGAEYRLRITASGKLILTK